MGFYRIHAEFMDRFLITNMPVFRVHRGIVDQHMATMPIALAILDISVRQTLPGQLLGYGHFVFESAAQDQGLTQINFVPRIEQRDLTIQRVIQRAGLRARMEAPADWDGISNDGLGGSVASRDHTQVGGFTAGSNRRLSSSNVTGSPGVVQPQRCSQQAQDIRG